MRDPANKLARLNAPGIARERTDVNPETIAEAHDALFAIVIPAADIPPAVTIALLTTFRSVAHVIGPVVRLLEKSPDAPVSAPAAVIVPEAVREVGVISPSEIVGVSFETATPFAPPITTTPSAVLTDKTPVKTGGGGGGTGPGPSSPEAA